MTVRLFTTGTHNGMTFGDSDIEAIYTRSVKESPDKIPFVLGHPKNDLPVVGYLPRNSLKKFTETNALSIGFSRPDATFSEESMAALKQEGHNKISVRLKEGVITHIGLVKNPAVKANLYQDFEQLNGVYELDEDIADVLEMAKGSSPQNEGTTEKHFFASLGKKFDYFFKQKNTMDKDNDMQESLDKLKAENAMLEKKLEDEKKEQSSFKEKQKAQVLQEFTAKVDGWALDDSQKQVARQLGGELIKNDSILEFEEGDKKVSAPALASFSDLIGGLAAKPKVVNGSVTAEFAKGGEKVDGRKAATDEIARQIKGLK